MPSSWTEDHAIELDGQMLPQELDQMMSLDQRMPLDQMMPLDQTLHQNLHQNQNLQLARGAARELALLLARTRAARRSLQASFAERNIEKRNLRTYPT